MEREWKVVSSIGMKDHGGNTAFFASHLGRFFIGRRSEDILCLLLYLTIPQLCMMMKPNR